MCTIQPENIPGNAWVEIQVAQRLVDCRIRVLIIYLKGVFFRIIDKKPGTH